MSERLDTVSLAEHEALAEEVGNALADEVGILDTTWNDDMAIAAWLLKAGYRKVEND